MIDAGNAPSELQKEMSLHFKVQNFRTRVISVSFIYLRPNNARLACHYLNYLIGALESHSYLYIFEVLCRFICCISSTLSAVNIKSTFLLVILQYSTPSFFNECFLMFFEIFMKSENPEGILSCKLTDF